MIYENITHLDLYLVSEVLKCFFEAHDNFRKMFNSIYLQGNLYYVIYNFVQKENEKFSETIKKIIHEILKKHNFECGDLNLANTTSKVNGYSFGQRNFCFLGLRDDDLKYFSDNSKEVIFPCKIKKINDNDYKVSTIYDQLFNGLYKSNKEILEKCTSNKKITEAEIHGILFKIQIILHELFHTIDMHINLKERILSKGNYDENFVNSDDLCQIIRGNEDFIKSFKGCKLFVSYYNEFKQNGGAGLNNFLKRDFENMYNTYGVNVNHIDHTSYGTGTYYECIYKKSTGSHNWDKYSKEYPIIDAFIRGEKNDSDLNLRKLLTEDFAETLSFSQMSTEDNFDCLEKSFQLYNKKVQELVKVSNS